MSNSHSEGNDTFEREFNAFFSDKLQPVIELVSTRKRQALWKAGAVAAVAFLVFLGVITYAFSPYAETLNGHGIPYWPLLFMLPATMAVIGFSITYILTLRGLVALFRSTLMRLLAEFIDKGTVYEPEKTAENQERLTGPVFSGFANATPGPDRFRGRYDGFGYDFFVVTAKTKHSDSDKKTFLTGIVFNVEYEGKFPVFALYLPASVPASLGRLAESLDQTTSSHSELVRVDDVNSGLQIVSRPSEQDAAKALLPPALAHAIAGLGGNSAFSFIMSFLGNTMQVALLIKRDRLEAGNMLDGFDFGNCREFCRSARFCLTLGKNMEKPTLETAPPQ